MTDFNLTYKRFSERSILIEWPSEIAENIARDVLSFKRAIEKSSIKEIVQINHAYNSFLITYDFTIDKINDKISVLKTIYNTRTSIDKRALKLWKIPVCYDEEFGLDLELISAEKKLSKSEIIRRHSESVYPVFFIGFLPGFLYLGGLDKQLHMPRRTSPRIRLKKGAVAIGGSQTGIYPSESPGGWHIIGNTPIELFNSHNEHPCFAQAGDVIQFVSVSLSEYHAIVEHIKNGTYQLESEVLDG